MARLARRPRKQRRTHFSLLFKTVLVYLAWLAFYKCPLDAPLDSDAPICCTILHKGFDLTRPQYDYYLKDSVDVFKFYRDKTYEAFEPLVDEGKSFIDKQYAKWAAPHVEKYYAEVSSHVGPHVRKVVEQYDLCVKPSVRLLSDYVAKYGKEAIVAAKPILQVSYEFSRDTLLPALCAFFRTIYFHAHDTFSRKLWPVLRTHYETHFAPSVSQIANRLRYHSERTLAAPQTTPFARSKAATERAKPKEGHRTFEAARGGVADPVILPNNVDDSEAGEPTPQRKQWGKAGTDWLKRSRVTVDAAMRSLQEDADTSMVKLMERERPAFVKKLRKLSEFGDRAAAEMDRTVTQLENGEEGEQLTLTSIRDAFEQRKEAIDRLVFDVRDHAESVAQKALDEVEELRANTISVLEDFFDVVLLEASRDAVHMQADATDEWGKWKSYHELKHKLQDFLKEVKDYNVDMEKANVGLRESQQAAHVLSQQFIERLSTLRGKSQYYLHKREQDRLAAETAASEAAPLDYDPDAEYVDMTGSFSEEKQEKAQPQLRAPDTASEESVESYEDSEQQPTISPAQESEIPSEESDSPVDHSAGDASAELEDQIVFGVAEDVDAPVQMPMPYVESPIEPTFS